MAMISVVMPTYNTSIPILKEAVESILNQNYQDFEFLIIDDGSVGETEKYLNSLTDFRVRIIRNNDNIGITKSLNIGFQEAKGKYIARMDSDDISMPDRFEKQHEFMGTHKDVIVCGTNVTFDKGNVSPNKSLNDMDMYRIRLLFTNPGPFHSTAFFRHEELLRQNIKYDEQLTYAQDYDMWVQISQNGTIYTLPETLLYYRRHQNQISKAHWKEQCRCAKIIQKKLLSKLIENVTQRELNIHFRYSTGYYHDVIMTDEVKDWYLKLIKVNNRKGIYNKSKFNRYIYNTMYHNINLTWNKDMTKYEKIRILFHYMPWSEAVKMLIVIGKIKIR